MIPFIYRYSVVAGLASVLAGTSGCAWFEPSRVEADFGNSVRQMVAEQIYDPAIAQTPSADVPELRGDAATTSVTTYGSAARETRRDRGRQPNSTVPVTGIASGGDDS